MHHELYRIGAVAMLISVAGCVHGPAGHAHRHEPGHGASTGLTVLGSGEAKGAPDVARSSIGIEVRAETAEQATTQANERMAAVIAAVKSAGVAAEDIRTHDFSVSFEREYPPQPEPAPDKGNARSAPAMPAPVLPRGSYRVSNTADVLVRDIAKIGAVLTAATGAGANNIWGIQFDLLDREPLHAKARAQAVARAQENARQLAELAGVRLGRIVSVEDQASGAEPRMYAASMRMEKADAMQVPVESGQLTVSHQVRLVYALE